MQYNSPTIARITPQKIAGDAPLPPTVTCLRSRTKEGSKMYSVIGYCFPQSRRPAPSIRCIFWPEPEILPNTVRPFFLHAPFPRWNTGSTRSPARFWPGFPSVEATLTKSREGWNTKMMIFDRELIAFCFAVDRRSGNGDGDGREQRRWRD